MRIMIERIVTKLLTIPLDFMTDVMGIPFSTAVGINSILFGTAVIAFVVYIFTLFI